MVLAEDPSADLSFGAVAGGRCCRPCGLTRSIVPAKGLGSGKAMVGARPKSVLSPLLSGDGRAAVGNEVGSMAQHLVQHDSELSGECDLGFAHPCAPGDTESPGLQI